MSDADKVLTDKVAASILEEARERLALAIEAEDENREAALDDLKFLSGEQWEAKAAKARKNRPCLTINRLPTYVRQVVNEQRKTRPAIDVIPADSQAGKPTADVMQGMIRHIERTSKAQQAYDTAFEYAVSCGFGHFRVNTRYVDDTSFDQEIAVKRIDNPFSIYRDPSSTEADHSDDRFTFITDYVDPDEFEDQYGFRPSTISEAGKGDNVAQWFEGEKVRVAEYWRVFEEDVELSALDVGPVLEGLTSAEKKQLEAEGIQIVNTRKAKKRTVEQYILTYDKVIKRAAWPGKYIPICTVVGGEMNIEGKKVLTSLIRFAKDPARMYNYWASAETEAMALQPKAPVLGAEGQFDGHEGKWGRANTENFAYLEYKHLDGVPPPARQPPPIFPDGLREGRMAAAEDVKAVIGIYDASLGARSNEVSGVAIRAREEQGDDGTYHFIGNQARAIEHAGRIMLDLIPKIYDRPRVVRIVTPTNEEQMTVINQTFIDPQTSQEMIHDLKLGCYDVEVRVGPSFESKRQEMVQAMVELSAANPQLMQLAGDLVVKNMDWPQAEEIAGRLQQAMQSQGQQKDPAQALAEAQVKVEEVKGQNAQLKGQMDAQIKGADVQMSQKEMELKQYEMWLKAQDAAAQRALDQEKLALERMALEVESQKLGLEMLKIGQAGQAMQQPQEPDLPESNPQLEEARAASQQTVQALATLAEQFSKVAQAMAAPRHTQLIMGKDGRPMGAISETVTGNTVQ